MRRLEPLLPRAVEQLSSSDSAISSATSTPSAKPSAAARKRAFAAPARRRVSPRDQQHIPSVRA